MKLSKLYPMLLLATFLLLALFSFGRCRNPLKAKLEAENETLAMLDGLHSSVECEGEHWRNRICNITNVAIWRNTVYIMVSDMSEANTTARVPDMNLQKLIPHYVNFTEYQHTTTSRLQEIIMAATSKPSVREVPYGLVWYQWTHATYHIFADRITNFHIRFCMVFGQCQYEPEELEQTQLIFQGSTWEPVLPAAADQLGCISSNKPIILQHPSQLASNELVIISKLSVGIGRYHFVPFPDGTTVDPPEQYLQSFRQRLLKCLLPKGLPVPSDFAKDIQPPVVTFLQRRATSRRSFLNLPGIIQDMQTAFPHVKYQILMVEGKTSMEIAHILQASSVMVLFHGAAMNNFVFLPQGAAIIDVNPPAWIDRERHSLSKHHVQLLSKANSLTLEGIWVHNHRNAIPYREIISRDPAWAEVTDQAKMQILEHSICPEHGLSDRAKAQCINQWLARDLLGVLLEKEELIRAMNTSLAIAASSGKQQRLY